MKKSEKKGLIILIIVSALIIIVLKLLVKNGENNIDNNITYTNVNNEEFVQVLSNGTKLNTSEEVKKERYLDGLKISNIQLATENGETELLAKVENITQTTTERKKVQIKIIDKNGNVLSTLNGIIVSLEPGQITQLNIGVTSDYANAYNFIIEEI